MHVCLKKCGVVLLSVFDQGFIRGFIHWPNEGWLLNLEKSCRNIVKPAQTTISADGDC